VSLRGQRNVRVIADVGVAVVIAVRVGVVVAVPVCPPVSVGLAVGKGSFLIQSIG